MSRDFELKFDEFRANSSDADGHVTDSDKYPGQGHTRHIAFLWPDKKMQAFNYSYLVTLYHDADEGTITLEFTSHQITIWGLRLENLFIDIMTQQLKYIRISDPRYSNKDEGELSTVHLVVVKDK